MIETYLLQYLAAFAEHKNLSDVAKAVNVTQPTVSRAMQKLEQELGLRLFVRTKNTIALTATGSLAVEYAAKQIDAQNEMVTALGDFDRASHRLHFGSIAAAPRRLLTASAGISPNRTIAIHTAKSNRFMHSGSFYYRKKRQHTLYRFSGIDLGSSYQPSIDGHTTRSGTATLSGWDTA